MKLFMCTIAFIVLSTAFLGFIDDFAYAIHYGDLKGILFFGSSLIGTLIFMTILIDLLCNFVR